VGSGYPSHNAPTSTKFDQFLGVPLFIRTGTRPSKLSTLRGQKRIFITAEQSNALP